MSTTSCQQTQNYPPPLFGKYQSTVSFIYFQAIYVTWYLGPMHFVYAMITFNVPVCLFYIMVIILQAQLKQSKGYVNFVKNIIQARRGLAQVKLIYEEEIKPEDKCLFGFFPHGVLAATVLVFMNFNNGPMKNMIGLGSRFLLTLPFVGLFGRLWGLQAVNPQSIKHLLGKGTNIGLIPGGFQEATLTVTDQLRVFIKERKGFIKYALQYNYGIYPVLAVNEHKYFSTFRYFQKFRLWLNKYKMPGVLFWNWRSGLLLPPSANFTAVVGKAIRGREYALGQKATQSQIDEAHARYIQQIKRIHEKHYELSKVPLKIY